LAQDHDDRGIAFSFDIRPDSNDFLIHEVVRVDNLSDLVSFTTRVELLLDSLSNMSSELELRSEFSEGGSLGNLVSDDPVDSLFTLVLVSIL
jgi:hypothetical protein